MATQRTLYQILDHHSMKLPTITPELREMYRRGIEDPSNLTRAERNQIMRLMPPEEEDHIIQTMLKMDSKEELIAKAKNAPDTLSKDEAFFLTARGPHPCLYMTNEDQKLAREAWESIVTTEEEEFEAVLIAFTRCEAIQDLESDKRWAERKRFFDAYNLAVQQPRADWVQKMVDVEVQQWGFVCFRVAYTKRADDGAWNRFKGYYTTTGEVVSRHWRGFPPLWLKHKTVFVSDDTLNGASSDVLRKRFSEMRAADEIPDGVRTDVFLAADEETLIDENVHSGVRYNVSPAIPNIFIRDPASRVRIPAASVRAVDPDHDTSTSIPTKGPYAGFNGEFDCPVPKVFDWLHYSLWAGKETMKQRYWQTQAFAWTADHLPVAPYPLYSRQDPKQ